MPFAIEPKFIELYDSGIAIIRKPFYGNERDIPLIIIYNNIHYVYLYSSSNNVYKFVQATAKNLHELK